MSHRMAPLRALLVALCCACMLIGVAGVAAAQVAPDGGTPTGSGAGVAPPDPSTQPPGNEVVPPATDCPEEVECSFTPVPVTALPDTPAGPTGPTPIEALPPCPTNLSSSGSTVSASLPPGYTAGSGSQPPASPSSSPGISGDVGTLVLECLDTSNPLLFERKELDAAKVWISTGTGITTRTARAGKGLSHHVRVGVGTDDIFPWALRSWTAYVVVKNLKTGVSSEMQVSWDEGFNSYTGAKGGIGIGHSGDNQHTGRNISEMVTADPGHKIKLTVTKVEGFAFDTTKFPRKAFHVVIPQERLEKNFEFTVPTTLPPQVP